MIDVFLCHNILLVCFSSTFYHVLFLGAQKMFSQTGVYKAVR